MSEKWNLFLKWTPYFSLCGVCAIMKFQVQFSSPVTKLSTVLCLHFAEVLIRGTHLYSVIIMMMEVLVFYGLFKCILGISNLKSPSPWINNFFYSFHQSYLQKSSRSCLLNSVTIIMTWGLTASQKYFSHNQLISVELLSSLRKLFIVMILNSWTDEQWRPRLECS